MVSSSPDGGIGRRRRLKTSGPHGHAGSNPALGTAALLRRLPGALACFLILAVLVGPRLAGAAGIPELIPEPPYPFDDQQEFWINSKPLGKQDLRKQPVLVMFWTFGCHNCHNSLPWIKALNARLKDRGLLVLGVHSPEFKYERDKAVVRAKTAELGLEFPVMIDNDFVYWKDFHNEWWPSFYVADARGKIRGAFAGEVHSGTAKAAKIEKLLMEILAE